MILVLMEPQGSFVIRLNGSSLHTSPAVLPRPLHYFSLECSPTATLLSPGHSHVRHRCLGPLLIFGSANKPPVTKVTVTRKATLKSCDLCVQSD